MPGKCLILSESTSPTQQQVWRSLSHMLKTKQSDMRYGPHCLMTEFTSCLHLELFWDKLSPQNPSLLDGCVLLSITVAFRKAATSEVAETHFSLGFQDLFPFPNKSMKSKELGAFRSPI